MRTVHCASLQGTVADFDVFGAAAIQAQKLPPDAIVQMAIQLAYYTLHRKPAPTYETAHTRKFFHGGCVANYQLSLLSVLLVVVI